MVLRAHWRHLGNMIELLLPSAHLHPQSKRQIDRFSHSCTAHGRKFIYLKWALLSPKVSPSHWGSGPHLVRGSLAHLSPQPKWHLDWFSRFCIDDRRVSLDFTMGRPCFPSKLPLPMGDQNPHLTHGFLGPPKSSTQTASRSVQPILQGSLVTDRPTDHTTQSVKIDRIYVRSTCDAA